MSITAEKKHIPMYQYVRVVATLLVLTGHATSLSIGISSGGTINPYGQSGLFLPVVTEELRKMIYSFHMPLFLILSGALFSLTFRARQIQKWILNRAKRLLIPLVYTALGILLPVRYMAGYYASSSKSFFEIIIYDFLLAYDINYLWFLLMLFQVNVIMALSQKIILTDKKLYQVIILSVLLFVSIAQFALGALPFAIHRTAEFLFWFYMGILFEKRRSELKKYRKTAILACAVLWLISYIIYRYCENMIRLEILSEIYLYTLKLFKMGIRYVMEGSGSLFVLYLFINASSLENKTIKILNHKSFSIYLFHCPVIMLLNKFVIRFIPASMMSEILYAMLLLIIAFASLIMSIFLDFLIQKLKQSFCK